MPELPEVEVTRRSFAKKIAGAHVLFVRLGKPLRWPLACSADDLKGRCVLGVRRRGKYLLLDFDHGMLLIHLGMSGSLRFVESLPEAGPHDHFDLVTTLGCLRLHDPRRFGAVVYADSENASIAVKLLGHLGMEPLANDSTNFDGLSFVQHLKRRNAPIKQVLLAGNVVVGVGNIYASEALFWAGIRPTTKASRLSRPRVERLRSAIIDVLSKAVERGGVPCVTLLTLMARVAISRWKPWSMAAKAKPARPARHLFNKSAKGKDLLFFARFVSDHDAARVLYWSSTNRSIE